MGYLGTIAQLCRAISSQLRHVEIDRYSYLYSAYKSKESLGAIDNRKKLVTQKYLLHMSSQYGELRPTRGWDRLAGLGHPIIFQRVSRLGSVTARHFISGSQRNFAALNRRRHIYSAGRPSRWALAYILVIFLYLWKYASKRVSEQCRFVGNRL